LAWRLAGAGMVVRVVRGWKMRTPEALFDEFAAAMQFPDYFGENWAALDECLADLSWLPAHAYAIVIARASEVLIEEEWAGIPILRNVIVKVAETWARPVAVGEPWDRPAVPFHVILQAGREEGSALRRAWREELKGFADQH